jgi:hypothetical protein
MSLIYEVNERSVSYYFFAYNSDKERTYPHDDWDTFVTELLGWLRSEHNLSGASL